MNDIIIDTLVEKINNHENQLNEQHKVSQKMSKAISTVKGESENIQRVARIVDELQAKLVNINWPVAEMEKLRTSLLHNNRLLENPKREKVLHVHTGSKLLWSIIALTVISICLIIGWITTYRTLNEYRMHDVCWRYLKLNMGVKQLQSMQNIELQFQQHPDRMTGQVEQQELLVKQQAEARMKAEAAQKEADAWKQKAGEIHPKKPDTQKRSTNKVKK